MIRTLSIPTTLPVSLQEVKDYLKIDHTEEDALLKGLIEAASGLVEQETGRSLLTRTWQLHSLGVDLPDGSLRLSLPFPPLQSVITVRSVDPSARVLPKEAYTVEWDRPLPSLRLRSLGKTFEVVYKAGYGEQETDIPPPLRQAILLLVAEMYEQRTATSTLKEQSLVHVLLRPYSLPASLASF